MTKQSYIELLQDRLANGDVPDDVKGKYHPSVLEKYIGASCSSLAVTIFRQGSVTGDYSWLDPMARPEELPVQDSSRGKYVTLPYSLMTLPDMGHIRYVGYKNNNTHVFRAITNDEANEIFSGLDVGKVDRTNYFYQEDDKLYFQTFPKGMTEVLVKVIPAFESLDRDDEFVIPMGMEYEMMRMLFDIIREKRMTKKELYNDRKPDLD